MGHYLEYQLNKGFCSRIVPEYNFLDARGLGAFEGKSLDNLPKDLCHGLQPDAVLLFRQIPTHGQITEWTFHFEKETKIVAHNELFICLHLVSKRNRMTNIPLCRKNYNMYHKRNIPIYLIIFVAALFSCRCMCSTKH